MKHEEDFHESKKERKQARKHAAKRDRSKFKKTDQEKRQKNLHRQQEKTLSQKNLLRGRVLAIFPEEISVEHEQQIYLCTLRGVLKKEMTRVKNLVTVGDFVLFEQGGELVGAIAHIEQRHSVLARKEHLRRKTQQLIAANIDQVLITLSVVTPPLKPALLDRYIIATYKGGMEPVILLNKVDLLQMHPEEKALFEQLLKTYTDLKIPLIALSAETGEGIEQLKKQMHNKASVFSGQSGVGKSTLINLITGLNLATREVIDKTRKGAHTTSTAQLIPLSFGGWCIDTPGIRSFGIWDLQRADLEAYFPEIYAQSAHCKFTNCSHSHEPGCALREAVEEGVISPLRFDSYLKLLQECD